MKEWKRGKVEEWKSVNSVLARQNSGGVMDLWGEALFCLDFLVLFDQAKST